MHCPNHKIPRFLCIFAVNDFLLFFNTTCGAIDNDLFYMSFSSYASLRAATMASDPELFLSASWFNPSEVRCIPASRHVDGNGILSGPLPLGHIQYFEWQRRCAFSVDDLVRVQRRWAKGGWDFWINCSPPQLRLVELVVIKLDRDGGFYPSSVSSSVLWTGWMRDIWMVFWA